jgi:MFS family permease
MKSSNRRLPRNVIILGLVSLCNDASSEMIYPLLPVFLTVTLGATAEMLGLIEGIAETTAAILKLFSGWLSDRLGKRKALTVAGYSLSALTRPFVAVATASWHVLIVRFGDRIGKGLRTAPRDALIADSIDPAQRGRAFGYHRAMDHGGAVIGPLLAMAVLALSANNYRLVFWLAVIPAAIGAAILIFGTKEIRPASSVKAPSFKLSLFDRNFHTYLFVIILFTLGNSSDAFLLLRAKDLGVAPALIPLLWAFFHVVKMLFSTAGGSLSDRMDRKRVIALGWLIYALVYLGFGLAAKSWHVWALFAVYGLFFALTEGAEKALVTDLVKPELRGTAFGIYNLAIGIGALPASAIMGVLWHRFSPMAAFGFGASMALLAILSLTLVRTSAFKEVSNAKQ